MSLKNKRKVTVYVPVEALMYEDEETGETVCGGASWPDLKVVRDYVTYSTAFNEPPPLPGMLTDWPAKARITLDLINSADDEEGRLRTVSHALEWAHNVTSESDWMDIVKAQRRSAYEKGRADERSSAVNVALREVAICARRVVEGRVPAVSAELFEGSTWKHSRISDSLTDKLSESLQTLADKLIADNK